MNGLSKEYVQGMLLVTFIAIPVLWYIDAISGLVAFIGMWGVVMLGTLNNNRKT